MYNVQYVAGFDHFVECFAACGKSELCGTIDPPSTHTHTHSTTTVNVRSNASELHSFFYSRTSL